MESLISIDWEGWSRHQPPDTRILTVYGSLDTNGRVTIKSWKRLAYFSSGFCLAISLDKAYLKNFVHWFVDLNLAPYRQAFEQKGWEYDGIYMNKYFLGQVTLNLYSQIHPRTIEKRMPVKKMDKFDIYCSSKSNLLSQFWMFITIIPCRELHLAQLGWRA